MKRLIAGLVLACLAGAPALAAAPDPANDFQSICMATLADPDAAGAQARALGWVTPPALFAKQMTGEMKDITARSVRWTTYEGGMEIMLAGDGHSFASADTPARVCLIMSLPQTGDLRAPIAARLGVGPAGKLGDLDIFAFEDDHGKPKAIDLSHLENAEKLKSQGVRVVIAGSAKLGDDTASMAGLSIPVAEAPGK
jgi:hypothetical protein